MLSLIFNQYDPGIPGGPIGSGSGTGRRNRILTFPVEGEPVRTSLRRRVLTVYSFDEVETSLRRRTFNFPAVHFIDTEPRGLRLAFDEAVLVVSSEGRRRVFEDDRDLQVSTGPERSRELIFERV
jgi:hypothetical protein